MNKFKNRLIFLLKQYDLRVMKLDELAGMYHGQTSSFVRGETEPKLSSIVKMLAFFKEVSTEWFVLGKGKPWKAGPPKVKAKPAKKAAKKKAAKKKK